MKDRLLEDAHWAIGRVFADRSFPPNITQERLEKLAELINDYLNGLREDMKRHKIEDL